MMEVDTRIEALRTRSKRCLCKYCGEKLSLKRIIFSYIDLARVEIYCDACGRIEYGVEPEVYGSAKYFVEELSYNAFPNLEDNEQTKQMSIAKVSEIITWGVKNLGLVDEGGFQVPIKVDKNMMGECVILTDADLADFAEKDLGTYDMELIKSLDIKELRE